MIAARPCITYRLPASRITQALTGGKIEKVWANVQRFLSACTNADIEKPNSIYLTGYAADEDQGENPNLAEQLIKKTQDVFGIGTTEPVGYLYPENTPLRQTKTTWQLTADDLDKVLSYITGLQPLPKYNLGPIELILSYDFKLINITTGEELPDQQYQSSLLIWLARSNHVSPILCFPFSQPDKDFWDYLENIENLVPFKFDRKYLRIEKANKKGTANMFSKL
ncbi:hypothetical protein [Chitinophaga sp. XS-30]|uniref:hypothetical protein n=1 Tax=Chitinophaga sp. XS-30 TaxID=2604421 RepID=UPI0011DD5468|nr:hypothetical protein [Chitinophaga sp. XS-30]QEH41284.1 hypothetical protein FW415_10515 [Chitinophaga sp. XS-30]